MLIDGLPLTLAQLFTQPCYIPTDVSSLLWAIPICLSISVVYKAIKIEHFASGYFAREVSLLFATIVGFLIVVAVVLWTIARLATIL